MFKKIILCCVIFSHYFINTMHFPVRYYQSEAYRRYLEDRDLEARRALLEMQQQLAQQTNDQNQEAKSWWCLFCCCE